MAGGGSGLGSVLAMAPLASSESTATPTQQLSEMAGGSGPLSDLDIGLGLGSGLGAGSGNEEQASAVLSLGEFTKSIPLYPLWCPSNHLVLIIEVVICVLRVWNVCCFVRFVIRHSAI